MPNEIFARHLLRIAKQRPNQTLADFRSTLSRLAKDCNFKDVSAAKYRDEMLRDSFINGILSSDIRQRLLEHKTLDMNTAYEQAVTLDDAKRDNLIFDGTTSVQTSDVVSSFVDCEKPAQAQVAFTAGKSKSICNSCGSNRSHDFKRCKAKTLNCFNCGEKGHFSRACRSRKKTSISHDVSRTDSAAVGEIKPSLCIVGACSSESAKKVTVFSLVGNRYYKSLLDTGSSKSFVNREIAHHFKVEQMAILVSRFSWPNLAKQLMSQGYASWIYKYMVFLIKNLVYMS